MAGGPAGSTPLFFVPINPNVVPTGSTAYVPIDVSAGGLYVSPGDQYAIAVTGSAAISAPHASWWGGLPGYSAGGKFARAGAWEIASASNDYGFRAWVDSALSPSGLQTLALTPTSEWDARLSMSGGSSIFSAGDSMHVDVTPGINDDRGLMEFNASGLPEEATIRSANLTFRIDERSQSSSGPPVVAAYGYQADGSPADADARNLSLLLGQSSQILNFNPVTIALDGKKLSTMVQTSPNVGIVAYQAAVNAGVGIVTTQKANSLPTFYSPPTLTLGYSIPSYPAQGVPPGDYNRDARVDGGDYPVWRNSNGTMGTSPADGDGDGDVDQADYGVWRAAFGKQPDAQVRNGGFQSGNLTDWNVVIAANTDVSFGFPRVESFDVDGDGQANSAMRLRLGRADTSQFGGTVAIEQQILLAAGDYVFSADVASQSLQSGGNTGPGNYELTFDGKIVDQALLNGTSIGSFLVLRDNLLATLTNVEAGYHTLRLAVSRGATNSREIYQFIDNIQLNRVALGSSTQAIPEPTAGALFAVALGLTTSRRRRPM